MAHQISFLPDLDVAIVRCVGGIELAELERTIDELTGQPWFHSHLKLIADFRGCATTMTGTDVQKLATYARRSDLAWGDTRWAVMASSDLIYGLTRVYMALTADYHVQTHVFRTAQEADDWLGIGINIDEVLQRAA